MNVEKEQRKDALVIRRAEQDPGPIAVSELLAAGREIDREFLQRVSAFPIGVVIRYEAIGDVRRHRIESLFAATRRILAAWPAGGDARSALRACYTRREFEEALGQHLLLYAHETRAVASSLRLPLVLLPLREMLASSLHAIMRNNAARIAGEAARATHPEP